MGRTQARRTRERDEASTRAAITYCAWCVRIARIQLLQARRKDIRSHTSDTIQQGTTRTEGEASRDAIGKSNADKTGAEDPCRRAGSERRRDVRVATQSEVYRGRLGSRLRRHTNDEPHLHIPSTVLTTELHKHVPVRSDSRPFVTSITSPQAQTNSPRDTPRRINLLMRAPHVDPSRPNR